MNDDDFEEIEAPLPPKPRFHTLRNVFAAGAFGFLFETRRIMTMAPGRRLFGCVLAGLNSMTVGAIFFGSQAMMGSLRMEDDVVNSLGAGLVTGSLISSNFMTSVAYKPLSRAPIMLLWSGIGVAGHAAANFCGADRIPDFEYDPIRMLLHRLAEPPESMSKKAAPSVGDLQSYDDGSNRPREL